jgi:hypothetical protein
MLKQEVPLKCGRFLLWCDAFQSSTTCKDVVRKVLPRYPGHFLGVEAWRFLCNAGKFLPVLVVSHPRRQFRHIHYQDSVNSYNWYRDCYLHLCLRRNARRMPQNIPDSALQHLIEFIFFNETQMVLLTIMVHGEQDTIMSFVRCTMN